MAEYTVRYGRGAPRFMHTVYVLQDSTGRFYKGMTNNLERRLREHRSGHTRTTRKMRGLNVVYFENFNDKKEASRREKYFKSSAGRRFLRKVIMGP